MEARVEKTIREKGRGIDTPRLPAHEAQRLSGKKTNERRTLNIDIVTYRDYLA